MADHPRLFCVVCGGDHEPSFETCDDAGMDKRIKQIGTRRWNQITAQVSRSIHRRRACGD